MKTPKLLPWYARKAGVSLERAEALWRKAVREATLETGWVGDAATPLEGGMLFLRVSDHGPGIAPQAQAQLFEPFFTTENTGSGLGLYICKELCEANQAIISYKRTPQGESCFHLQLAHPDKAS